MEDVLNLILKALQPVLEDQGLFLVDLKLNESSRLVRVFIDKVPAVTIAECAQVSRALENELDEVFDFSAQYALEVSSPGLDQPFKVPQQYEKYRGRQVEVLCEDGSKVIGKMGEMKENSMTLLVETPKKSNKKQMEELPVELEMNKIKSTKPYVKF